jgi:hypothetical protein
MKLKLTLFFIAAFLMFELGFAQWEIKNISTNSVNAPVEADGFLFNNTVTNSYFEAPKFSGKYCIYGSNLWMGGLDQNGNLHMAAQTYKQNGTDYWPAPLTSTGTTISPMTWSKVWHIKRSDIDNHIANYNTQGYQLPQELIEWPGSTYNGLNQILAPFTDVNNNGIYDPSYGDYPNVLGDDVLYIMYNDKYASHGETGALPIEAEIYSTIYAYNSTSNVNLDQTVFVRHRIRNRSQNNTYNNFFVGIWNDFNIGNTEDDLIGTDINRKMIYGYNADNYDSIYGNNPPAVGVKVLNHPLHNSMFYDNTGISTYDNKPTLATHYYNYLKSIWKDGSQLNFGSEGYQTSFGNTNYCFSGNTDTNFTENWEMLTPKDYRIIGSVGPFTLAPNAYITVDIAYIYAKGTSSNSLNELGISADVVQNFYNATINNISNSNFNNKIRIFPNPANDILYINFDETVVIKTNFEIFDVTGQLIKSYPLTLGETQKLDVAELDAGVYLITYQLNEKTFFQKFIKQ